MWDINVGTPDVLQGRERKVVIVSTVLSKNCAPSLLGRRAAQAQAQQSVLREASDGSAAAQGITLLGSSVITPAGLFFDSRALNVAMTRAQSLLVVVGSPTAFALDRNFREIMGSAVDHCAFVSFSGGDCLPAAVEKRGAGGSLGLF